MNISVLLPFKENYSRKSAGAVSLFVKDTVNSSKFKKNITIFGCTSEKDFLTKNYINLKLTKNFFKSSNKQYVKNFINHEKFISTDILEIHNRPSYVKLVKSFYKQNIFLYFHNDPLSMDGSKTLIDRIFLIKNVNKIIFNSNWSKNRFLIGFKNSNNFEDKILTCYQST